MLDAAPFNFPSEFQMKFQQQIDIAVERNRPVSDIFKPAGVFTVEHFSPQLELIDIYQFPNGIVTVGKNYALDVAFNDGSPIANWYIGLIDNSGYTTLLGNDTMASHAGWAEFSTYTSATRPLWNRNAASAGAVSSGTTTDFTFSGAGTLKGAFITSDNTKSGTTGTLWAHGLFLNNVVATDGDTLRITYAVAA